MNRLRNVIIVAVLGLVAAACSSSADNATGVDAESAAQETASTTSEAPSSATSESADAEQETVDETPDEAAGQEDEVGADDEGVDESPDSADETPAEVVDFGPPDSLTPECTNLPEVSVGLNQATLVSGGQEYTYQWTVPSNYEGSPTPVVLDFHAIGSNGAQQAIFSGWTGLAATEGFISVQPTGLDDPTGRPSWELPQFEDPARDDVAFVVDLIDAVTSQVCVDPARVYSTGMSNGGLFTSELVCDLSERIAAAVSVAGVTHHESCSPTRAVPYLAFHGTDDTVVPFNGGGESTLTGAEGGSEFFEQVIPDEFAEFASSFGCTDSVDSEVTADITLTSYSGCRDDVPLGFYTIEGGGHTWPGSPVSAAIETLGFTNLDISATEIAWDFFSQHTLGQ